MKRIVALVLVMVALGVWADETRFGDKTSMTVTFDPSPNRGEKVYKTYCFHCHGEFGDGSGHIGRGLDIKPVDLTDPALAPRMTARNIAYVVREGSSTPNAAMIPWKTVLPEELIKDVALYTERLAAEGRAWHADGGALAKRPSRIIPVTPEQAKPKPRLLEGKMVTGLALIKERVGPVVAYDDGKWRDPSDLVVVDSAALLSDVNAKPVKSATGWIQPVKEDYRGKEGWQKLRWGMTAAEVLVALGKVEKLKPSDGLQLAWKWKIGDTPVVVEAILVGGHLGGVMVRVPGNSFETVRGLVVAKYGAPQEDGTLDARWSTPESSISVRILALTPSVLYLSKAHAVLAMEQVTEFQKHQADEGL